MKSTREVVIWVCAAITGLSFNGYYFLLHYTSDPTPIAARWGGGRSWTIVVREGCDGRVKTWINGELTPSFSGSGNVGIGKPQPGPLHIEGELVKP